jgi:uncharacterized protein (TIGR00369 family)
MNLPSSVEHKTAHENENENWPFVDGLTGERRALQQRMFRDLPFFRLIGLRLEELAKDYTKVSITHGPNLVQPTGILHGGIQATLIDTAAGQAIFTTLKLDRRLVTVHLNINYFKPVEAGRIFAEASVVHKGRSVAHTEARIATEDGVLVAAGWCVFAIAKLRK